MDLSLRYSRIRLSQGQIFWREVGQGQVLVFLHAANHDGSQWLPVIEQLKEQFHCFAPDLPGFGDSKYSEITDSIEWQVKPLAEYFQALQLQPICLVGHSLGAWIAASYALEYPDSMSGLVLVTPVSVEIKNQEEQLPLMQRLRRSLLSGVQIFRLKDTIHQSWQSQKHSEMQPELLQEHLKQLKVPLLILQGEQESQAYTDLTPTAKLQKISEGGNNLPEVSPEQVAEAIKKFVATLSLI